MTWVLRWRPANDREPHLSNLPEDEVAPLAGGGFAVAAGYLAETDDVAGARGATPAARLASAYGRHEERSPERLRGGFLAAVWDAGKRRLLVARDHAGIQPAFYFWRNGLFLLSPSIDPLLDQPEVGRDFNRAVIAEQLLGQWPLRQARETFYEEVSRLEPAHSLTLEPNGGPRIARYWDPVPPGFAWATDEELAAFPTIAEQAVVRCLSAGADSLALSGGFDSVSIAALAAPNSAGRPLHAVSLRFAGTVCDEGDSQEAVAKAFGMPIVLRTTAESLDGEAVEESALAFSAHSPGPVLSVFDALYRGLLRSARASGLARMMMGTGGDELFGVDLSYGADCLASGDIAGLWRFYRMWRRTSPFSSLRVARLVLWDAAIATEGRRIVRRFLRRSLPRLEARLARRRGARSPWVAIRDPALRETLAQRSLSSDPLPMAPGERLYVRALRSLTRSPLAYFEQDEVSAWASHFGFTLLFPYFDPDLMGLILRTPPEHLIAGGWSKAPLRRLVAERLPGVSLRKKKVDFTQIADDLLRPAIPRIWSALGSRCVLQEQGIVDASFLRSKLDVYLAGGCRKLVSTWIAVSTEAWLQARSRRPG